MHGRIERARERGRVIPASYDVLPSYCTHPSILVVEPSSSLSHPSLRCRDVSRAPAARWVSAVNTFLTLGIRRSRRRNDGTIVDMASPPSKFISPAIARHGAVPTATSKAGERSPSRAAAFEFLHLLSPSHPLAMLHEPPQRKDRTSRRSANGVASYCHKIIVVTLRPPSASSHHRGALHDGLIVVRQAGAVSWP
ncbi:hypothetical protein SCHPADRAFT_758736 [Schizopora paradoxa]|uniref:Uncharacterized protein n=1 Tax=Schizopora paradoxa TaxID=27342 RepID=A0A0H2RH69_9AGAM|nr:hypothetical protein SCHPADRAFT_758736 [Schizopora paradoxa]